MDFDEISCAIHTECRKIKVIFRFCFHVHVRFPYAQCKCTLTDILFQGRMAAVQWNAL